MSERTGSFYEDMTMPYKPVFGLNMVNLSQAGSGCGNRNLILIKGATDFAKWGNKDMQLPDIARQIGKTNDKEHVYIEDYVYAYLHELGKGAQIKGSGDGKSAFPQRVALFGHACRKEERRFYLIYGAASVMDELENGKSEEQIRREYFEEYELIGYVNIYGGGQKMPGPKEGYCIFFEKNEPMQNYLLSCYERRSRRQVRRENGKSGLGNALRKFFYGGCIIVLAMAATSINDYDKMYGFVEAADRVVSFMETEE